MAQISIRKMELSDVQRVYEIECESFVTPWSVESITAELTDNDRAIYLVVCEDEYVVGYAGLWQIFDEGHITNVAISLSHRGKGYGGILVDELISTARQNGMAAMTLEVRRSNFVAQSLYESRGFEAAGIRPGYYVDEKEDAIIMWKYMEERVQ